MKLFAIAFIFLTTTLLVSGCTHQSKGVTLTPPPKKVDVVTKPVPSISSEGEIINGIPVPPEPDPVENNATLAGVDSNKNGVRDDVERGIATSITKSNSYNGILTYAAEYQRQMEVPVPTSRDAGLLLMGKMVCALQVADRTELGPSKINVHQLTVNTPERRSRMHQITLLIGGFSPEELPECK